MAAGRSTISMKVAAQMPAPATELALTNKVYVSMDDFKSLKASADQLKPVGESIGDFVTIKDFVFSYAGNAGLQKGIIAFNGIQRKLLLLGYNDIVDVVPYIPSLERMYLSNLTLEVSYNKAQTKGDEFNADDLIKMIQRDIVGQILTVDQIFVMDFRSIYLIFKVKTCEVVDLAEISKGLSESADGDNAKSDNQAQRGILHTSTLINLIKDPSTSLRITGGKAQANTLFRPNWNFEDLEIGGLDQEFSDIFRRAFASRIYPIEVTRKFKIQHVKGILLFGPPGTGKTLMARQISKMINGKEPQIVNGPEILNPYVGKSEENVRKLFAPAEQEQAEKGDQSDLHIIVFDELDAICKQRGSRNDGTGVGDTVVNQLLSKMDGVNSLNNVLVIGMTNRKDMIDEALLRAGRFEVHMEISLPDEKGRLQILQIHTKPYRENKCLANDVDIVKIAAETKNFSGSDIAGLIRNATSFAMNKNLDVSKGVKLKSTDVLITKADFDRAILEARPAFATDDKDFENTQRNGIIKFGTVVERFLSNGQLFVQQVKNSARTPLVSVLLEGQVGSGKTALAAKLATGSDFPYIKLISPESLVGYSEAGKCAKITKMFDDSYRSPISCIVIDDLERLLDYVRIGPRFSNMILQTLLVLLKKEPPKGRRLLILATSSNKRILEDLELLDAFNATMHVPQISQAEEFKDVLKDLKVFNESELESAVKSFPGPISIKKLIMIVEMARQNTSGSTLDRFITAMKSQE